MWLLRRSVAPHSRSTEPIQEHPGEDRGSWGEEDRLSIYATLRGLPPSPPHPHKLAPEPAPSSLLKRISQLGTTKMPLSLGKRERLLPEHSGFCSPKSPCRGRRRGEERNRMLPALSLTAGVDALGRAGAAPDSLPCARWFIPQIFAERLQCAGRSGKHAAFITSCNPCRRT